jgi:hypothetical protein
MMAKSGRKRSTKARTPSGHLSRANQPRDYGNIRVIERHSRFAHFIDDKGRDYEGTCYGRLWIVGAFDGLGIDSSVLRDQIHDYDRGYWGYWPSSSGTANYLQENRHGHDSTTEDLRGEWFNAMDARLSDAGHQARQAVLDVSVDRHAFPDEDKDWAARIINSRVMDKRRALARAGEPVPATLAIIGVEACDSDWAMLDLLRQGAMALAEGKAQRRAA